MLLWGFKGSPSDKEFIDSKEARKLLDKASPTSDLSPPARKQFITDEVDRLEDLREQFDIVAEERCQRLVRLRRYGKLVENKRFQVVYPVLPMDVLGVYVLLPNDSMHPSIRIEGAILAADVLDKIESGESRFQKPKDFGLDSGSVKDEIAVHGPMHGLTGKHTDESSNGYHPKPPVRRRPATFGSLPFCNS